MSNYQGRLQTLAIPTDHALWVRVAIVGQPPEPVFPPPFVCSPISSAFLWFTDLTSRVPKMKVVFDPETPLDFVSVAPIHTIGYVVVFIISLHPGASSCSPFS